MSESCSINIILDNVFNMDTIYTILKKGYDLGFKYHFWDNYGIFINSYDATIQFLKDKKKQSSEQSPPCILTIFYEHQDPNRFSNFILFFYEKDLGQKLIFVIDGFGSDCIRKNYHTDLSHYVPLFLSLCTGFSILELHAEIYSD